MHDVLAHTLSGLVLQLDGAGLLGRVHGANPELRNALDRAHDIARDGLRDAHRAISTLRDDTVPGPDQLPTLVTEQRRLAGVTCTLTVQGRRRPSIPQAGLALYRTIKQALANVRKHATGAPVHNELPWAADGGVLVLTDDGTGHQPTDRDGAPG